jgi:O-antigen ligase
MFPRAKYLKFRTPNYMNGLAYLQPQNPIQFMPPSRENPNYGYDIPQDFTYDPGRTSSLFELGYVPTKESLFSLIMMVAVFLFIIGYFFRNHKLHEYVQILFLMSIILVFLGPLTIPAFLKFHTTLGLAKMIALGLVGVSFVNTIKNKRVPIIHTASFIPICLYILSLLLSVFTVTNTYFFTQDFLLILSGLVFYYISFEFADTESSLSRIISTLSIATLFPAILVLYIYIFKNDGAILIAYLYPRYENSVFTFDLQRGRILSIIDLEFFIPFVLFTLITHAKKMLSLLSLVLLSFAVYLTHYRYRFLTYVTGVCSYLLISRKSIRLKTILVISGLLLSIFTIYMVVNISLGKPTIIDRFMLQDRVGDYDSLRRRFVMFNQAWELFIQHPILGVGIGNYKDNVQVTYAMFGGRYYEPYYKILQNVYAYPHNWFIQVLAENGIVGFTILL